MEAKFTLRKADPKAGPAAYPPPCNISTRP